ncbi:protein NO VEIN domain-containing protein [Streptomyces sp. NPDC093149]|uniref:protein NO VEIN domain-containing protein n=1 Tax=Streptomyces sp. NPDC093149 TaxID=3366031 RepID=UPI0037F16305
MVTARGRPVVDVDESQVWDAEKASAVPHVLWSRAAEEARRETGAAGEQALLELLRRGDVPQIRHVAAESDAYGYDIEAMLSFEDVSHLEVKSTTDPTRLVIHLTRHEYEVMLTDTEWSLAAVLVGADGSALNVATVSRRWLHSAVPHDKTGGGRWESARLVVPTQAMTPGLFTGTGQRLLAEAWLPNVPVWVLPSPAVLPA